MVKAITKTISIRTAPLNWVVKKNKADDVFLDNLNSVRRHIIAQYSGTKKKAAIMKKLAAMAKALQLQSSEELSALYLTKTAKHPEFSRKVSSKSLANLKPNAKQSTRIKQTT
jgi:hypothetical protein